MPDLGIMFRLNDRNADPAAQYGEGLRLILEADRLGIESAWITSHHFGSDKGSIASPLLFLAAAGQHAKRIRLGAAVVVLTLEDPVRVAEDAALADHLADGRIELGLGTGLEDWAFPTFGIDWEQRHAVFDHKLATLKLALSGGELRGGKHLHPPGRNLGKRIWRIGGRPEEVRRIAEDGDHLILAGSKQLTLAENRARQHAAIGEFRARATPAQKIAASRSFFVHKDQEQARNLFEAAIPPGLRARRAEHKLDSEDAAIVGDPAFVREAVTQDPLLARIDLILAQVMPAKLPVADWVDSLTLLKREVFDHVPRYGAPKQGIVAEMSGDENARRAAPSR